LACVGIIISDIIIIIVTGKLWTPGHANNFVSSFPVCYSKSLPPPPSSPHFNGCSRWSWANPSVLFLHSINPLKGNVPWHTLSKFTCLMSAATTQEPDTWWTSVTLLPTCWWSL